jgi:hypothetical protein
MSKFTAKEGLRYRKPFPAFLTAPKLHFAIYLESAAFVFHISTTTQGITGSLRAACSEPV